MMVLFLLFSCKEDVPTYEELNDTKTEAKLNVQKATDGRQDLVLFPQVDERKDELMRTYKRVYRLHAKKKRLWIF